MLALFSFHCFLAPVVKRVDSAILWINLYPVDNAIGFPHIMFSFWTTGARIVSAKETGARTTIYYIVVLRSWRDKRKVWAMDIFLSLFMLRSHSVCQLTIERTLNKNKLAETEQLNKPGKRLFSLLVRLCWIHDL